MLPSSYFFAVPTPPSPPAAQALSVTVGGVVSQIDFSQVGHEPAVAPPLPASPESEITQLL